VFDKQLADIMRPFTDLRQLSEGNSLYGPVLDKFVNGKQNRVDADELRMAVDRLQLQLKSQLETLSILETKVSEEMRVAQGSSNSSLVEDKGLSVIADLLMESIILKKVNLVGCKMKIYQERMKDLK
jgi:hypothetical protein